MHHTILHYTTLGVKLLDRSIHLAGHERKRNNARHVHLGSKDVHVELEFLANRLDVLESFLVIRACATNPDLDLVLDEQRSHFAKSADDALECGCDL